MKKSLLILLLLGGGWLWAQTNSPAPATHPTEVNSDSADFDLKLRRASYFGHVSVVDPKVKLTCALLVIDLPETGSSSGSGHLSHVLAETNVIVDFTDDQGTKYHITSEKAVYVYKVVNSVTNETVTFTGNPIATTAQGAIYSEPMVWDRADGHLHFTNPHMISMQNLNSAGAATNSPIPKF